MGKLIRGCFTNAGFSLVVGILSLIVTVLTGREVLGQIISEVQQGTANLWSAIIAGLTSPVSLPVWAFFLLVLFVMAGLTRWVMAVIRALAVEVEQRREWVNFRELWFDVQWDSDGAPHVLNRAIQHAKCGRGDCMQQIVGSDKMQHGGIHYLKCKDDHYVGNTTKYEDFVKEREANFKQHEEEENREKEKLAQEYEQLLKDKEAGKITQEEIDKWERTEYRRRSPIPAFIAQSFSMGNDNMPPRHEEDFYARLVYDYESEQVRQLLQTSLKTPKN